MRACKTGKLNVCKWLYKNGAAEDIGDAAEPHAPKVLLRARALRVGTTALALRVEHRAERVVGARSRCVAVERQRKRGSVGSAEGVLFFYAASTSRVLLNCEICHQKMSEWQTCTDYAFAIQTNEAIQLTVILGWLCCHIESY